MFTEADIPNILDEFGITSFDLSVAIENSKREKVLNESELEIDKIKESIEKLESELYNKEQNYVTKLRNQAEKISKKFENKYYKTFHDEYIFVKEIFTEYNKNSYKKFDTKYNGTYIYKNEDNEFIIYTNYHGKFIEHSDKEISENDFLKVMKQGVEYLTNKYLDK